MSFEKWFADYLEITGLANFDGDCMKEAYAAGQRDMRERAAAECAEVVKRQPYFAPPPSEYADAIRAIKLESEK